VDDNLFGTGLSLRRLSPGKGLIMYIGGGVLLLIVIILLLILIF
jgi:hypothetical protein